MSLVELRLEDGTRFVGRGFGAPGCVAGEVVFSTAMAGYVESLTDPSYRGQILVLTYPLVGGYGVPIPRPKGAIDGPYESDRIQVQALVTQNPIGRYSHHASERSLSQWLVDEGIPGVAGIDTRALTQHLRARGTMNATLTSVEDKGTRARHIEMSDVNRLVAPPDVVRFEAGARSVLLIDAGAKDNLVRCLLARGLTVIRAPFTADVLRLANQTDSVAIGSGPGDPKALTGLIDTTRVLLETYSRPIFGVCLGSQIMALAVGGDTAKLPYGHRGVNQPVRDLASGRCYVTSQNHGYAVVDGSLPAGWAPSFININDNTNEGLRCLTRPHFGVQFHPEAHPGPRDAAFLFDYFAELVHATRRQ